MSQLIIIKTDGSETIRDKLKTGIFTFVKTEIDATNLEFLSLNDGRVIVIDADALKERRKPVNIEAVRLYRSLAKPGTTHHILGDVVVWKDTDFGRAP